MSSFKFSILKKNKNSIARVGVISTPHGDIETPAFVPVGTNGSIKACTQDHIDLLGVQLMFCNTYHLVVHPGSEVVKSAGGIHKYINRKSPIITDSGGFQIFSLTYGGVHQELKSKGIKKINHLPIKVSEDGVQFQSYRDGRKIFLSPELSIDAQKNIGADIIITLDELLPYHTDIDVFKSSFYRNHRWQIRSYEQHKRNASDQALYPVIHGGLYEEFRKESCKILSRYDFDGYAIGGSLGKCTADVKNVLDYSIPYLDDSKPRHLLGIADIPTLKVAIENGIDTFDSSYPTKCARHGMLFTDEKTIKIGQLKWKNYHKPISNAPICKEYTGAYLHHLYKMKEPVYATLASMHNIWYLNELCRKIRENIV
jgi:queuine tRNA-ribosyltransferase